MLIDPANSCLLVIDVQAKLVPGVVEPQKLIDNCTWLMKLANLLEIPLIATEQYPQGLGHTVESLLALVDQNSVEDKVEFSCAASQNCLDLVNRQSKDQVIIAGMESHICVLQSAIGLVEAGKQVFVCGDSISARSTTDTELAIERMRAHGVDIVSREMVGFEWIRSAAAEQFRTFSKEFLQ